MTLSAHRGKHVVLAFFPAAFTGVCTKELCTFRDSLAQLNEANAIVFGISADGPWALKEFANQQRLNFPLLSDFHRTTIESYGVANPDWSVQGYRQTRGVRGRRLGRREAQGDHGQPGRGTRLRPGPRRTRGALKRLGARGPSLLGQFPVAFLRYEPMLRSYDV